MSGIKIITFQQLAAKKYHFIHIGAFTQKPLRVFQKQHPLFQGVYSAEYYNADKRYCGLHRLFYTVQKLQFR